MVFANHSDKLLYESVDAIYFYHEYHNLTGKIPIIWEAENKRFKNIFVIIAT